MGGQGFADTSIKTRFVKKNVSFGIISDRDAIGIQVLKLRVLLKYRAGVQTSLGLISEN